MRALQNVHFCSNSRKPNFNHPDEKIIGTGIHTLSISSIKLKLHFVPNVETDAEIGQKRAFCEGLVVVEPDQLLGFIQACFKPMEITRNILGMKWVMHIWLFIQEISKYYKRFFEISLIFLQFRAAYNRGQLVARQ